MKFLRNKIFFIIILFNLFLIPSYSLLSCEIIDESEFASCNAFNSGIAYYISGNFDDRGEIINAKISGVSTTPQGFSYKQALCCTSDDNLVKIDFLMKSTCNAAANEFPFSHLESPYNSKISKELDHNYNYSICLQTNNLVSGLDIRIRDRSEGLESFGYSCLYRFGAGFLNIEEESNLNGNSKVSSCDARFDDLLSWNNYPNAVYSKLVENVGASGCDNSCASKLDNRIYISCVTDKPDSCSNVPPQCEASLRGSWVKYDTNREIKCEYPFDQFRDLPQSESTLDITSESGECKKLASFSKPVLVNSITVNMKVIVCLDE